MWNAKGKGKGKDKGKRPQENYNKIKLQNKAREIIGSKPEGICGGHLSQQLNAAEGDAVWAVFANHQKDGPALQRGWLQSLMRGVSDVQSEKTGGGRDFMYYLKAGAGGYGPSSFAPYVGAAASMPQMLAAAAMAQRFSASTPATQMTAKDFMGQWKDSLGNVITASVSGKPKDTGFMVVLAQPPRKDIVFSVYPVHVGNGWSSWRCGNSVMDLNTSNSEQLTWATMDGRYSMWWREAANTTAAVVRVDPKKDVAQSWDAVHTSQKLEENARVPREAFVNSCKETIGTLPDSHKEAFEAYANSLFDTGTALMLPAQKTDLGKHCFGYATLLVPEFYGEEPKDGLGLATSDKPTDSFATLRAELDADWEKVEKNSDGRVTKDVFTNYFMEKNKDKLVPESAENYRKFLEQDFKSSTSMMLPSVKDTLGGHCFRYGGLMAGEFYFDAAKDAATGCGCSAPVADVLGVTK